MLEFSCCHTPPLEMRPRWLLPVLLFSLSIEAAHVYRRIDGPTVTTTNDPIADTGPPGAVHRDLVPARLSILQFPRLSLMQLAESDDNSTSSVVVEGGMMTKEEEIRNNPELNTNSDKSSSKQTFAPHHARTHVNSTFPPFLRSPPRSRAMRMKKAKDGVKIALAKSPSSPSSRLQNDILIVPPPKGSRLYVLVLISVHESSEQAWKGYECGRVNLDGFIKLTAFLHALKEANSSPLLSSTLSLGAVLVDTCASDLRTIADLYELLAGSDINKSDLVAVIRDDDSHLPNVDLFVAQLGLPVIYAYPERGTSTSSSPLPIDITPISTASPLQGPSLNGLLVALKHTNSSCFSLLYDAPHKGLLAPIRTIAERLEMCVEERIQIDLDDNNADLAPQWKQLLRAFREELILITAAREMDEEERHLREERLTVLAKNLPNFPFQKAWIRHFWATAYECHIAGEAIVPGEQQYSRPCSTLQQTLNFSSIAPAVDILPLERAVEALATALRKLVDSLCPGANLTSILDCTNQPATSLSTSLHSLEFVHSLTRSLAPPVFVSTPLNRTVFFDRRMRIRRLGQAEGEMYFTELGLYDENTERLYASRPLTVRERDGAEHILQSACPSCPCATLRLSRHRPPPPPSMATSLKSPSLLAISIVALLLSLLSLMGIYHQLLSEDAFRVCGMFSYAGLTCLCTLAPFFVLQSSPLACSARRFGLSTCIAAVYAPVFVETVFLSTGRYSPSGSSLFWLSAAIVGVQAVMVGEWSLFESSSSITFIAGEPGAWRCAPGASFESRLMLSATIPAMLIPLSLILAMCRAKWMRPLTSLLTLHLAAFYMVAVIGLPLVAFERRDIIFAVGLLAFALTYLFVSLFRGRELSPIVEDDEDSLPRKGRGIYGQGLMRIGGPLDVRCGRGVRRLDGTIGSVEWNEEDERKFNEAMAAARALTAREFREPTPLIDYPMDDKYIYAETMKRAEPETLRPTERLFVNTNTKPPKPAKRTSLPKSSPEVNLPPPSVDARTLPIEDQQPQIQDPPSDNDSFMKSRLLGALLVGLALLASPISSRSCILLECPSHPIGVLQCTHHTECKNKSEFSATSPSSCSCINVLPPGCRSVNSTTATDVKNVIHICEANKVVVDRFFGKGMYKQDGIKLSRLFINARFRPAADKPCTQEPGVEMFTYTNGLCLLRSRVTMPGVEHLSDDHYYYDDNTPLETSLSRDYFFGATTAEVWLDMTKEKIVWLPGTTGNHTGVRFKSLLKSGIIEHRLPPLTQPATQLTTQYMTTSKPQ
uniref:Uncharacterized protein n=1 Tax=Pristionchus pacificus TaxID=54126 RepID=A0A2A6CHP6_PRIPA|eukprot:PDM77754.1 hypothetical protein PRIPAC_34621 [Pristionchus pacificus]